MNPNTNPLDLTLRNLANCDCCSGTATRSSKMRSGVTVRSSTPSAS